MIPQCMPHALVHESDSRKSKYHDEILQIMVDNYQRKKERNPNKFKPYTSSNIKTIFSQSLLMMDFVWFFGTLWIFDIYANKRKKINV